MKSNYIQTTPNVSDSAEYNPSEDIYNNFKEEDVIDPEDTTKHKSLNEDSKHGKNNEKDFSEDVTGSDLDVPEMDYDEQGAYRGTEDEENEYFSLGGDDHDDLDEDNG